MLEEQFLATKWRSLSELNQSFITRISKEWLRLPAVFAHSGDFNVHGERMGRLVRLLQAVGATSYLSGPSAKSYLDEQAFVRANIALKYVDYSRYPQYEQLHGPFEHQVSVIDLLCMKGSQSVNWLTPSARSEASVG